MHRTVLAVLYRCTPCGVDQVCIGGRLIWPRQFCGLDSYLAQVLICLIQIFFAIVAITENLWVHKQFICCRFMCFSCDGCIHGTRTCTGNKGDSSDLAL